MRDIVVRWIGFLLFIAISILLIKLFIWILPILLILFIGYCIYDYFKNKIDDGKVHVEKASRDKNKEGKNKKIVIIDEEKDD